MLTQCGCFRCRAALIALAHGKSCRTTKVTERKRTKKTSIHSGEQVTHPTKEPPTGSSPKLFWYISLTRHLVRPRTEASFEPRARPGTPNVARLLIPGDQRYKVVVSFLAARPKAMFGHIRTLSFWSTLRRFRPSTALLKEDDTYVPADFREVARVGNPLLPPLYTKEKVSVHRGVADFQAQSAALRRQLSQK